MDEAATWEELELPVLRWVHASAWAQTGQLNHISNDPSSLFPGIGDREVDEALRRLEQHGLIRGHRAQALAVWWTSLRPTADGLRVLGEWPPAEAATVNVTLAKVLRALAPGLDEADGTAARRAGSALSKMSGEVVLDIVRDRMKDVGEDLAT